MMPCHCSLLILLLMHVIGCRFIPVEYTTTDYNELAADPNEVELLTDNIGQIIALQSKEDDPFGIVIGNTHLYWNPRFGKCLF
jgi:hypothetical protein